MMESIPYALAFAVVGVLAVAAAWDIARSKLARFDAIEHLRDAFGHHVKAMDARDERIHIELGAMRKVMQDHAERAEQLEAVARQMRVEKGLGRRTS